MKFQDVKFKNPKFKHEIFRENRHEAFIFPNYFIICLPSIFSVVTSASEQGKVIGVGVHTIIYTCMFICTYVCGPKFFLVIDSPSFAVE